MVLERTPTNRNEAKPLFECRRRVQRPDPWRYTRLFRAVCKTVEAKPHSTPSMNNPQVKQRIKIKRPSQGYERGKTYVIVRVDPNDNTLVAADSQGKEGPWIQWRNCEACADDINWNWLKAHLPSEALELLSAFEGLDALRLKDDIRDRILMQLPNLKEKVLTAQAQLEDEFSPLVGDSTAQNNGEDACNELPF